MSAPLPSSALDGHCSAIDNNILYVFSSNSFQSLPLKENATWSTLPMGQPVTGPACVRTVPGGDESQAAFYVVGGSSQDSSYHGLQRYTFATQKWETLEPTTFDMQGRTNHSAAYLNDTQSILVYAGSQPQAFSDYSTQTFVISTSSPFNIRSFTSKAPPVNAPILLPWTSDTAVMVGGATSNQDVWTFDPDNGGWNRTQITLRQGFAPGTKGTLTTGSDGGKVLATYDLTTSPNTVSQVVLQGPGGSSTGVGQSIGSSRKRKRDLTLADWPSYNATNAPSVTRSDYAVAQDSNGLSVISGGSSGAPVNIFNEQENSWVDNGVFFSGKANSNQVPLVSPTSSGSTTPSATSSSSSTASATGATLLDDESSRHHMLKVLGITLGTLFGIAACFIIALLLLRWRKQKRRRQTSYLQEKGDRMSFQDRGTPFMKESAGSNPDLLRIPPAHRFTEHNSSHNSFAILAGKLGKRASRNNLGGRQGDGRGSSESTRQLVRPKKSDISKPVELDLWGQDKEAIVAHNMTAPPDLTMTPAEPLPTTKRSSGWSRYFAPTDPQIPSAYDRNQRSPAGANPASQRPDMPHRIPSTVLVPPLDFGRGDDIISNNNDNNQRFAAVVSGSPAFNNSAEDLARRGSSLDAARGQRAHIHTPDRNHSRLAQTHLDADNASQTASTRTYSASSHDLSSSEYGGHDDDDDSPTSAWTPVSATQTLKPAPLSLAPTVASSSQHYLTASSSEHAPRPPSSNYTASVYDHPRVLSRGNGNAGFFPGNREALRPTSRGNNNNNNNGSGGVGGNKGFGSGLRSSTPSFPTPLQQHSSGAGTDELDLPKSSSLTKGVGAGNGHDQGRESTVTVFPRGVPSAYYANRGYDDRNRVAGGGGAAGPVGDMSWLRLDDAQNRI